MVFIERLEQQIEHFRTLGIKVVDSQHGSLGKITVQRAFEVSSNVGITKLAYENYKEKPEQFINRLYEMGLNQKLGVDSLMERRKKCLIVK